MCIVHVVLDRYVCMHAFIKLYKPVGSVIVKCAQTGKHLTVKPPPTVTSHCRGVSYLSVDGDCTIESVDEIGEIVEVEEGDLQESSVVRKVVEGEIDGVLYSDEYCGCIACNGKVKSEDDMLGECTKCGMLMKLKKCKKLATARVAESD